MKKIWGMAHRGYPNRYPENTLASFQAACDLNYSHLELDVQLSKDGIPVVFHDTVVDRMTNGSGAIKDLTLKELRQLKISGTEQIPTLEEALDLLKDQILIDIELKQMGNLYPGLEEAVVKLVGEKGMREQVIITSFDHYSLVRIRELDPRIDIGMITGGASPAYFRFAKQYNCSFLCLRHLYITEEIIHRCEQEGIQLVSWTVDGEKEMMDMALHPNILVCTNELELWASVSSGT
jgi:glycerophosphoryl diester phosphodiesterase